jgi:hypothetical protein
VPGSGFTCTVYGSGSAAALGSGISGSGFTCTMSGSGLMLTSTGSGFNGARAGLSSGGEVGTDSNGGCRTTGGGMEGGTDGGTNAVAIGSGTMDACTIGISDDRGGGGTIGTEGGTEGTGTFLLILNTFGAKGGCVGGGGGGGGTEGAAFRFLAPLSLRLRM